MAMYPVGRHDREASTEQLKEDLRHLSQTIEELVSYWWKLRVDV